jgi:hypothetical protein
MTARLIVLVAMLMGCRGIQRETDTGVDGRTTASLTGAWDARLSLTSPYQIGAHDPGARMICGTIGFVDNRHRVATGSQLAEAIGAYDLDLSRLGLHWRADEPYPEAIATVARDGRVSRAPQDSVTIVLDPGSSERIVLLGRHVGVAIDGQWLAQSLRGTATGQFSLHPHGIGAPTC